MNKVIMTGNIVRDVEERIVSGYHLCANVIAVKRAYPDKDGNYPTDFFEFQAWGNTCNFLVKYAAKGNRIVIVGRIQNREFEDKDGNKRRVTEILVDEVELLSQPQQPKQEPKPQTNVDPFRELTKTVDNEIKKEEPKKPSLDDLPF